MAVDKMVDSGVLNGALDAVADAIRAKAGISGTLAFPDPNDFADAIDEYLIRPTGTKSITENGTNIDVAQYSKVDVNVSGGGGTPTGDDFYAMYSSDWDLKISTAFTLYYAFLGANCGATKICLWNATGATGEYNATYAIYSLPNLTTVVLPKITRMARQIVCNNKKLTAVDLSDVTCFDQNALQNNQILEALIIRKTSVPELANINAFNGTPFASGKTGGTLYVPNSLISSYQAASNWSTILGYANNSIQKIEGTIYETQYADGTPIPTT